MAVSHLREGIPRIAELEQLQQTDFYRDATTFNEAFLARHRAALEKYGEHWGKHPFKLWSRRWEYPFAASRLLEFAAEAAPGQAAFRVLDAGSGVTFFPYFICSQVPNAEFVCVDSDPSYHAMFDAINHGEDQHQPGGDGPHVQFIEALLQKLPLPDAQLDAVCCISVLEHTNEYPQIVEEFLRVLRPGGLFVLTFDLSLDGKFTLPRPQAEKLLALIQQKFVVEQKLVEQLSSMHESTVLSSDHVRATDPSLLPWTFPVRVYKAVNDLATGKGWTGGFRSRTVFCCAVRKPV